MDLEKFILEKLYQYEFNFILWLKAGKTIILRAVSRRPVASSKPWVEFQARGTFGHRINRGALNKSFAVRRMWMNALSMIFTKFVQSTFISRWLICWSWLLSRGVSCNLRCCHLRSRAFFGSCRFTRWYDRNISTPVKFFLLSLPKTTTGIITIPGICSVPTPLYNTVFARESFWQLACFVIPPSSFSRSICLSLAWDLPPS